MGNPFLDPRWLDVDSSRFADPNVLRRIDELSIRATIRQSLKDDKEKNKVDEPTDLPKRTFKTEEIEEDEQRRYRELYGPPTPPRQPRQADAMKSSKNPAATTVATASGTNSTPSDKGAVKHPQEAAIADDSGTNQSGVFIPKRVFTKLPVYVQSAVSAAVAHHRQLSPEQSVRGVVDVMDGYNEAGKPALLGGLPAPPKIGTAFSYAGQGSDGVKPAQTGHKYRMNAVRAALNDPDSVLSIAVREETQYARGGELQRPRGKSSAGSQPGSGQPEPRQKKIRRG
ncbi:hypothetical protein DHEL01_v200268 [Diaporthe helianthi]|uniref:Uncharacterized protein n=1 Tax=Diaporthe helianthi TaxID=158607 RepID=A0A2P5IFQ7_DIAHE|nr:hypothetical protein DHEL01_v200268 [Diaporthe helianthi]